MNKDIVIIKDWAGNILLEAHKDDPKILETFEKNADFDKNGDKVHPDIYAYWKNPKDKRNVYEWIDF